MTDCGKKIFMLYIIRTVKNGASYTIKAGILALEYVEHDGFCDVVVADQPGHTADTVKKADKAGCDTGGVRVSKV